MIARLEHVRLFTFATLVLARSSRLAFDLCKHWACAITLQEQELDARVFVAERTPRKWQNVNFRPCVKLPYTPYHPPPPHIWAKRLCETETWKILKMWQTRGHRVPTKMWKTNSLTFPWLFPDFLWNFPDHFIDNWLSSYIVCKYIRRISVSEITHSIWYLYCI